MKTFLFLFALLLTSHTFAHDYFFAFAEVQYIDSTGKMEVTLSVSTHDLESVLNKNKVIEGALEMASNNVVESINLEKYLLEHFKISSKENCQLSLIGSKTLLTGVTNFYFESEPFKVTEQITFFFDLLMYSFPEQQNKITLYLFGKTYTKPFLQIKNTQTINLENR
tara:strand:+ start:9157 stop:9657 length:501 start_codon:yes stop_codon:yes gene_type:complete